MTALIHLKDRGLLGLSGADAHEFLQGMVTCDINKLSPTNSLYGAHLTPQGRFLDDFFVCLINNQIVLDCNKKRLMPLAKTLHNYIMRFNVGFEDLSDDYDILASISPSDSQCGHTGQIPTGIKIIDPRLAGMGYRIITTKGSINANSDTDEYHQHRIKLAVPDGGFDGIRNKTIAGELCLEYLNGVDYEKGCYIGQEITARTHFRTQPKKRLMAITYQGAAPAIGAEVKCGTLSAGNVFSTSQGYGIAILRLKDTIKGKPLFANGVELEAHKPQWADYEYN